MITGRKIVEVRDINDEELEDAFGDTHCQGCCTVLVLEDGTKIFPSQDPEGNGPGAMFGIDVDGKGIYVMAEVSDEKA